MPGARAAALALVLALGSPAPPAAGGGDGKPEFPVKAALARHDPKAPYLRNFPPPQGRKAAEAPVLRVARGIAGANLVFADLDGNGRFDDPDVDGWTVEGNAYLVPWETPLLVGAREVRVQFAADGSSAGFRIDPVPGAPGALDALELVNALRLRNGIPPVTLDPALSRACALHSAYCTQNGITHDEIPGNPGWTEEGARAGKASSVANAASALDAVAGVYCQFYHRLSITDPRTRALGIGTSSGVTSIDGASAMKGRAWNWPVIVPAPGTAGQPRAFDQRESPRAYPERLTPGFPVTLEFPGSDVRDVEAEFLSGPKGRTPVPFLLSWPGKPAHETIPDNFGTIALVPEQRLAPGAAYSWRVSFTRGGKPGEASGYFTTGRDAGAMPPGR